MKNVLSKSVEKSFCKSVMIDEKLSKYVKQKFLGGGINRGLSPFYHESYETLNPKNKAKDNLIACFKNYLESRHKGKIDEVI